MSDKSKTADKATDLTADQTANEPETKAADQATDEGKTEPKAKPKAKPKGPDPEELVDFTAPYDPTGEKRDIFLAVNGETVRVKRGETVQIKRKFVEAWNNSLAQTNEARRAKEKAQDQAKTPLLNM